MFGINSIYHLARWRFSSVALCGCAVIGCVLLISGCGSGDSSGEVASADGGNADGASAVGITSRTIPEFNENKVNGLLANLNDNTNPSPSTSSAQSAPAIAVIDINEVADRVGTMTWISKMVDDRELALRQNFTAQQQTFMLEYTAAAQQIGNEPTAQEEAALLALQQNHMQQLSTQWNRMQQDITAFHDELKKQFVDSVRPVAAAVARSKDIPTVLTSGQVFSSEDSCDITVEVADEMRQILKDAAKRAKSTASLPGNLR